MTKRSHGPLFHFAKNFPYREVNVGKSVLGDAYVQCVKDKSIIAYYTRERDARRQLRILGYTQEGNAWRIIPKQKQPEPVTVHAQPDLAPTFNTILPSVNGSADEAIASPTGGLSVSE